VSPAFSGAHAIRRERFVTNPNGSGISLGHPLGATDAIVTAKAPHELLRVGGATLW